VQFLTSYRPTTHGFRFGNRFRHHVALGISTWGRCNGIAQVSLDYFRAGRTAPTVDRVPYDTNAISGLGAASADPNRVDLFVHRHGDRVATKSFDGRAFSDWRDLSSSGTSMAPSAAAWAPGRIDVVVRGNDAKVWHTWFDGGAWAADRGRCNPRFFPEDLDGQVSSSPAIAAPFQNRVEVYARGMDGSLWFKYYDGTWHEWGSLGRPPGIELTSDPSAASQSGWMTALVRGSDGAIWQKEWANNRWQPWRSLGGVATAAPAIASPFPGRAEAYHRGTDGQLYLSVYEGGRWGPWASLGAPPPGLTADRPAAVSHWGILDVFARANGDTVWHRRWANGGWGAWQTTEVAVPDDGRRLTDAILARLWSSTLTPLIAAAAAGGPIGIALLGSIKNYVTLRPYPNSQLFQWASVDEMQKLTRFLQGGNPIPVCLIDSGGGFGHEVVGFGGDINIGGLSTVRVYDPNYPGCDDNTITLDPRNGSIMSSSGESWRALWIRDDYHPEAPPP
jgi:hypothetical protein